MILSRRYLMLSFKKSSNEYHLYIPKYIDFRLVEEELVYTPKVLRVGLTSYYKRPTIGYSYKIEGTVWQKTFYELLRQDWYEIWAGVFVRTYINFPSEWEHPILSGAYNLFILTGEVVIENLEIQEGIDENPVQFTLRYKKVYPVKRPLWLANATFVTGTFAMACIDIGKLHTSDNGAERNIDIRSSMPPDGTIYYASYYPGLTYTFTSTDWEILPDDYYTTWDTSLPYTDADLTPTYVLFHNGNDN